jgi:YidC/Oxa1 family membrane protein insertase
MKDPYYVSPIVLGATMYVQQKMTPMTGMDPTQETMMKMMPILFAVFMIPLPSGLVLYILVSTLLGIAQQWWLKRAISRQKAS